MECALECSAYVFMGEGLVLRIFKHLATNINIYLEPGQPLKNALRHASTTPRGRGDPGKMQPPTTPASEMHRRWLAPKV